MDGQKQAPQQSMPGRPTPEQMKRALEVFKASQKNQISIALKPHAQIVTFLADEMRNAHESIQSLCFQEKETEAGKIALDHFKLVKEDWEAAMDAYREAHWRLTAEAETKKSNA